MKFFVSEDQWDLAGYTEHLKTLRSRMNEQAYYFFHHSSFQCAHIYKILLKNGFNPLEEKQRTNDPTYIQMYIRHCEGRLYRVEWKEVTRFFFDYGHSGSQGSVMERGLDDWRCDEIFPLDDSLLAHEIVLASKTTILIYCRDIMLTELEGH
ncbi:hypothetical protein LRR81_07695 [Metabacillus sp. GX 13764]|uniref:hypothetical protein n=1 Tax=Metabacillus kandeliae TaxID=2900151 RepID=UPI001E2B247C|nr:hypothetical protein [Metabacillus kandeliae]MCD7034113.1 hypothetical protein [Metabacillus kandeliae]